MPKATGVKPRLNSLDELFGLESDSKLPTDTEYALIPFAMMDSFPGHPFHTYTGQRKDDMIESIREKGILQPLIIRAMENDRYQILSGHNRKQCAVEAGLASGPAVIKRNLSDDEALIYVIETNLMQRSFNDMAHSEKAAVLALHHSKLFSQGKRNDESIYLILSGEAGRDPKVLKTPAIKVGKDIYTKYFRPNQPANEVRGIVEKALELYFSLQQHTFRELYEKQDTQHMLLLLSIQNDYIRKPLPDPVWWLAGDNTAVREFMTEFIRKLESFIAESEFEEDTEK